MSGIVVTDGHGRWPLPHGADPADVLAEHALAGKPVLAVLGEDDAIEVHYDVGALEVPGPCAATAEPTPAPRVQRVAAYAIVVDRGRMLLSQLASRVPVAGGLWSLPGGGIDPGEEPVAAVAREVREETAQEVLVGDLVQVQSAHWAGTNAVGVTEDFHAVRLVHRARCPEPRAARVMEVDGSTGAAAWVPLEELRGLPLTRAVEEVLPLVAG